MHAALLPLLVSNLKLTLAGGAFWYLLLAAAVIVLAILVYRYTLPPVSTFLRTLLWSLRGLALVLILFMIFEPVISFLFDRTEEPTIALLIDRSASLGIQDEAGDRSEQIREFLTGRAMDRLRSSGRLRAFAFADTVEAVSLDSLEFISYAGVGSNPAAAWQKVEQSLAAENLAAVLLLSDGIQNLGPNPVRLAEESSLPIHALGVGDTTQHRDAVISEILTNEITYVGSKVPIDVRVRAEGLPGTTARLRLLHSGGREIASEVLRFPSPREEIAVSMEFTADQAGDVRLIAALDSVPGEYTRTNNTRSVMIRVLDAKSRVVLLSGPPTADLTFVRQVLESDTTLRVQSFVELNAGKFLGGGAGPSEEALRGADLIVLLNYPTAATAGNTLQSIRQVVETGNTPLMLFAGPNLMRDKLAALADVLPVQLATARLSAERVVLRASASHPVLTGAEYNPAQWSELPPVQGGAGNFTVAAAAQSVVKLSRERAGIDEDEPAVVFSERAGRRSAAVLCWNIHRWKLGVAADAGLSSFFDGLMSRSVSWLIAPVEEKRVKVTTTKRLYSGGETVRFSGQVYGGDLKPRDDAAIDLRVGSGDRVDVVPMKNRGNGRYEGNFTPWADGDYRFEAVAAANGDTLGSDQGRFAIEAFNIELIDTRARFDVLQRIAEKSGARFAAIERPDSVLEALNFDPVTITTSRELPLWNRASMLWVIIFLLAAEWTIRKRSGML